MRLQTILAFSSLLLPSALSQSVLIVGFNDNSCTQFLDSATLTPDVCADVDINSLVLITGSVPINECFVELTGGGGCTGLNLSPIGPLPSDTTTGCIGPANPETGVPITALSARLVC